MTCKSYFTVRWGIDDPRATLSRGKAESNVFDAGGFRWTAYVKHSSVANFSLKCVSDHRGPWRCDAEVGMTVITTNGTFKCCEKDPFCFDDSGANWKFRSDLLWSTLLLARGTITVKFRINILSSSRLIPTSDNKFVSPNRMSNVVLKIGDEKIHVSKEYLAVHSPVFETLFFGSFAENGSEEIEIKDVVYEEFLDLLHLIYPGPTKLYDYTVLHILKLADRFQMQEVMDQAEEFIRNSRGIDNTNKLLIADQYRFTALRDHCLNVIKTTQEVIEKIKSPDCADFSDEMKLAIYDRIKNL